MPRLSADFTAIEFNGIRDGTRDPAVADFFLYLGTFEGPAALAACYSDNQPCYRKWQASV